MLENIILGFKQRCFVFWCCLPLSWLMLWEVFWHWLCI